MDLPQLYDFIKSVGVGAAIAFWLLSRTDKKLDRVISLLEALVGRRRGEPGAPVEAGGERG